MAFLAWANASAGPASNREITLSTSASKSLSGYTALIRPQASASRAGSCSASSASRIARIRPVAAATNADAPPSGINATLVLASMKMHYQKPI